MDKPEEKTNKKLIGIVLVILLLVITGYLININSKSSTKSVISDYFSDASSWKDFNSIEGAFKITLPTFPKHETHSINIPDSNVTGTLELYTADNDTSSYFIQAIRYIGGIDVSNPKANIEGAFNGRVAEIPNYKIISSNFSSFVLNDSLDYQVQSGDYYIYGKMVLVDQRLYVLEMACEISKCSTTDYQTFTNSFELQ